METCYFYTKGILENKKVTVDFRWGDWKLPAMIPGTVMSSSRDSQRNANEEYMIRRFRRFRRLHRN